MPNIYLRLPESRCQFFRHRDPRRTLAPSEPLVFNQYMPAFAVMRNSLTNAPAVTQTVNSACFSQQQWNNMARGFDPTGQKKVMKRDRRDYPTFNEVQLLCGKCDYTKSNRDDYLCIKLPTEVEYVDTVRVVTPSWNLDRHGVSRLTELLQNEFRRSLVEWSLATFDFCTTNGRVVCRSQSAMLERYMMRYGIEPTADGQDNLRRVIERWLQSDQNHFKAYSCFDMQYIDTNETIHKIDEFQWM